MRGALQRGDSILVVFDDLLEQRLKRYQWLHCVVEALERLSMMALNLRNQLDAGCVLLGEHAQFLNVHRQRIDSLFDSVEPLVDLGEPLSDLGEPLIDLGEPLIDLGEPLIDLGEPFVDPLAKILQLLLDTIEPSIYVWHRYSPSIRRCHGRATAFFEQGVMIVSFA